MSVVSSIAYNLQNHGTDYNLVTNGDRVSAGSSRTYAWQATSCGSGNASYLVDTLAQKCLWGSGSSVAVHDCVSTDQAWSIQEDDSVDTYIIQNVNEGGNGFLSLYEDMSFNLSDGSSSYSQWSFQSETPPASVTWDVCAHINGLVISSSSTGTPSSLVSETRTGVATTTTSSSLSASGMELSGPSETLVTALETSTSTEERLSAAAATSESPNSTASGASMPSAATQTPSDVPQSNDARSVNVARCILLAALMAGVFLAAS